MSDKDIRIKADLSKLSVSRQHPANVIAKAELQVSELISSHYQQKAWHSLQNGSMVMDTLHSIQEELGELFDKLQDEYSE